MRKAALKLPLDICDMVFMLHYLSTDLQSVSTSGLITYLFYLYITLSFCLDFFLKQTPVRVREKSTVGMRHGEKMVELWEDVA